MLSLLFVGLIGASAQEIEYVNNQQLICLEASDEKDLFETEVVNLVIIDLKTSERTRRELNWHHNVGDLENKDEVLVHYMDETGFSWKMIYGKKNPHSGMRNLHKITFYSTEDIYKAEYLKHPGLVPVGGSLVACYKVYSPNKAKRLPLKD